jgi:hypothetical protein
MSNGTFAAGETVYQVDSNGAYTANAVVLSRVVQVGANGYLNLANTTGFFRTDRVLYSSNSGAIANVRHFTHSVGVVNINNTFTELSGNFILTNSSNVYGNLISISSGTLADFSVSNTLSNPETITLYSDFIAPYANVALNANTYGFPANASANIGTVIEDALNASSVTIGGITGLSGVNPGINYDTAPMVVVYEPRTYLFDKRDYLIRIANTAGIFIEDEMIIQDTTLAKAVIRSIPNTEFLICRRIQFENVFQAGSANIVGQSTGATAIIVQVDEYRSTPQIGLNASVDASVQTGNGSVTALDVYDSGFGYIDDELLTFTDGTRSGSARAQLLHQGFGEGAYQSSDGFLSASKKLFDGRYYQEYSYEVQASVTLDKYKDMLKQITHVAGTAMYGAFVKQSHPAVTIDAEPAEVEIS